MDDFKTVTLTQQPLHPRKRPKYSRGLVLGVDEFDQEQLYFMERDQLHNRALHGYGTVWGLNVLLRDNAGSPEVLVSAGLAVDPLGRAICVPTAQCAQLNAWLAAHRSEVMGRFGSPPLGSLSLYVVLCYRECETDMVPIPSGPCRSQDDTIVASRIADSFELRLSLDPPPQVEEDAVRRFGDLLARIEITDAATAFLTREEMENLVRGLASPQPNGSPPEASPPVGSPPDAGDTLYLHSQEAQDILRAASRVWVTEVRPTLMRDNQVCPSTVASELCVLLAELAFDVSTTGGVLQVDGTASDVTVDQEQRPVLLHTRLLQEWLARGACAGLGPLVRTFATLFVQDDRTIVAWVHHPVALQIPPQAVGIRVNDVDAGNPVSVSPSAPGANVFVFSLGTPLPQLLVAGSRVAVSFDATLIDELGSPVRALVDALRADQLAYLDRDGDRLYAYQIVGEHPLFSPPVGGVTNLGDLADVTIVSPGNGDVLTFQGGQWVADAPAGGGPTVPSSGREETALTRIVALSWQHRFASLLDIDLDGSPRKGLAIAFGKEDISDEGAVQALTLTEDTFQVFVEREVAEGGLWERLRVQPASVVPLERVRLGRTRLIAEASSASGLLAKGAAYLIDEESQFRQLFGRKLLIVVKGDFILDETRQGRAIDAEHVRGQLPTGDRPAGNRFGVQGGRFESWVRVFGRFIDLNRATVEELRSLPRVGPVLAERIVERRTALGEFRAVEDLLSVSGIGEDLLNDIRPFIGTTG